MKGTYYFLTLITCLCTVVSISCSKDDPAPEAKLVLSTETLSFSGEGETKSFHIQSNQNWTVSSSESWCVVTPASGAEGTIKIDATVSKNPTTTQRTAVIMATAGSLSKQIAITQSGTVLLTVGQSEYNVLAAGGDVTVSVQSSGTYLVSIGKDWITTASGSTETSQKFTVASNSSVTARSATITFSLSGVTQVVTINQEGKSLTVPADMAGVPSNAVTLAQKIKVGWNLGNTLEATGENSASETLWGNPLTTKTLIDGVKAAGFNAIRIPCAWSGYIEDQATYRIKDSWLARVKEVVGYCTANDMYVIINIHWDGGWLENNPVYAKQVEVNKKQKALWEQIAVYFRDQDEHLLFAGTNEVHFDYGNPTAENIAVQQSFNQTFVDAVRSTGGKNAYRNLIVQSYNTNITLAKDMVMPNDAAGVTDRLMAEVHFYDPYDFTLDNTSNKYLWGADFAGSPYVSTWGQEAWVDEAFAIVKTKFIDKGIPVILGEYGISYRLSLPTAALTNHTKARNHYLNYVNKAAKLNGLKTFYWDSGFTGNNGSGLFNRATGEQVYSDAITAIVSAFE